MFTGTYAITYSGNSQLYMYLSELVAMYVGRSHIIKCNAEYLHTCTNTHTYTLAN